MQKRDLTTLNLRKTILNLRQVMILGMGTISMASVILRVGVCPVTVRTRPSLQKDPTPGFVTNTRNTHGARLEIQYHSTRRRRHLLD